jgi:hypothetical protein
VRNLLLLAVLLLAACSSAPPTGSPTPTLVPVGSPSPIATAPSSPQPSAPAGEDWRVLGEELWLAQTAFAVRVALAEPAFEMLWSELGQADPPPHVDFASEMVIYLGMSGSSSCPEVLEGLVVDEQNARVYGQWRQHQGGACTDDLAPQGILLAVRRDAMPQQTFLLSLRETPICADCPDHPDQLLVDPTATGSR